MRLSVVGVALGSHVESPGLEAGDEGGVVEGENLLEDVGPGVGVEDDVVDVGAGGRGPGGDRVARHHKMGPAGEGLPDGDEVEDDEGRRRDVQEPGQPPEVAPGAHDQDGEGREDDGDGEKDGEIEEPARPGGDAVGDVTEGEEPDENEGDEES